MLVHCFSADQSTDNFWLLHYNADHRIGDQ